MSNKWLYPVYGIVRSVARVYYFFISELKPRAGQKLYIYTDSRGFSVSRWYCKKNPFRSYISKLARHHKVSYSICQYKHTTLIDFLFDIQGVNVERYDRIVLHVGVVDFSPRTISQAREIIKLKSNRIIALFGEAALRDFEPKSYSVHYSGEESASLYGVDAFEKYIVPALNRFREKLIWIGVNPVLPGWRGNYTGDRPININNILNYQRSANERYEGVKVDILNWNEYEIKRYTVDNIHLSDEGFAHFFDQISDVWARDAKD